MMQSVAIDKDTTNVIFISYMGYLGLNALMAYWILWASGEVGSINGLYGYLIENFYIIIIVSIVLIWLCIPFIYVFRTTDALRESIIKEQNEWLDKLMSFQGEINQEKVSDWIKDFPQKGICKFKNEINDFIEDEKNKANADPNKVRDQFRQKLLNQKKELAKIQAQSKDTKISSLASFVNIFSLFLGPALSSLAANAGLSIGSEAFSELVSKVMSGIL